jgi:hypothetical protein
MSMTRALPLAFALLACGDDAPPPREAQDAGRTESPSARDAALGADAGGCTPEKMAIYDRLRSELESLFGVMAPPLDLINAWYAMHMQELDAVWAACPEQICEFVLIQYQRCRESNGPDAAPFEGCLPPPPECQ